MSAIIIFLAPSKLIQFNKKYAPWLDKNYREQNNIKDIYHKTAVSTDHPDDWRLFRSQRNIVNRLVRQNKINYYSQKLNRIKNSDNESDTSICNNINDSGDKLTDTNCNDSIDKVTETNKNTYNTDKKMWSAVKTLTNTNKNQPPRLIISNGEKVTSLKKIANLYNSHTIDKINKIRDKFTPPDTSPLDILKYTSKKKH